MISRREKIIAACCLLIFALGILIQREQHKYEREEYQKKQSSQLTVAALPEEESKSLEKRATSVKMNQTLKNTELSEKEILSLAQLTQMMKLAVSPKATSQLIIQQLAAIGLKAHGAIDANKKTGTMTVVRTDNSLDGTRYFHTQSFSDIGKNEFIQHMSFELRNSPDAFESASTVVSHSLFKDRQPSISRPDYKLWKHDSGYITWIKVMTAEDLKDDPFNAYTKDDVGTVRIVTELDVEEDHDSRED